MGVEERIEKLEATLKVHRGKLQRLQTEIQNEMQAILLVNGGLIELKKLQEDLNTTKETNK